MRFLLKNILSIFFVLNTLSYPNLFAQEFEWAINIGQTDFYDFSETDNGRCTIEAMEVDSKGNIYLLGTTDDYYLDLDPGEGEFLIDNISNQPENTVYASANTFIIKLDESGSFLWAKEFGISKYKDDRAIDLALDKNDNVYTLVLAHDFSKNSPNFVLSKFDPNGNLLLRKEFYTDKPEYDYYSLSGLEVDDSENIYIYGQFNNELILTQEQANIEITGNLLTPTIIKFNPIGNYIWHKTFEDRSNNSKLKITKDNQLLFVNYIESEIERSTKIHKVSTNNGNILFSKKLDRQFFENVFINGKGEIILTGSWDEENVDADPGEGQYLLPNNVGTTSKYLLWLSEEGNFIDIKLYLGHFDFFSYAMSEDVVGNLYVGITYEKAFDADPSEGVYLLEENSDYSQGAILKFDESRAFTEALILGENGSNFGFSSIKNYQSKLYAAGIFVGTNSDFDPSENVYSLSSLVGVTIYQDGYVFKLSDCFTEAPVGDSVQVFCSSSNPRIADLEPNFEGIIWFEDNLLTNQLSKDHFLENNKTYYASYEFNGCPNPSQPLEVKVELLDEVATPILNPIQSFCKSITPKISDIKIEGDNIIWFNSENSSLSISEDEILVNGHTYYAASIIAGCQSARVPVTVELINTPIPSAESNQSFCINNNPVIADIVVDGQSLNWYLDESKSVNLIPSTAIEDGATYFVSQTLNGCESELLAINIQIFNVAPPDITNLEICALGQVRISDINVDGENIKWYKDSTINESLSPDTIIEEGDYFLTQTMFNCESSRKPVKVVKSAGRKFEIDDIIYNNQTYELKILIEGSQNYEYSIDGINYQSSNLFRDVVGGNYIIYAREVNGCYISKKAVTLVSFPKFFTPNGDGINDFWAIEPITSLSSTDTILIYDRYGKLLAELTSSNNKWDGYYNGVEMPSSDYWYLAKINGSTYNGHFSLKR